MIAAREFSKLANHFKSFDYLSRHYYQIGKFIVCLVFANEELIPIITRAFARLIEDKNYIKADLTIYLIDTSSIKIKLPKLDWNSINQYGYRGYDEDSIYWHYFASIDTLSVLNGNSHQAYYIVKDAKKLPWWVSGSPLQVILHWWMREQGMQLTHAAAIADEKSSILLTGPGGAGKSTTTLTCLEAGLNFLGEDYCLLAMENIPKVYSIYHSAKLTPDTQNKFSNYHTYIANLESSHEKGLIYYGEIFPKQLKNEMPINAAFSLMIGEEEFPVLKSCKKYKFLKNIMLTTTIQLPVYQRRTAEILREIVERVDCYELILGKNYNKNAIFIKKFLRS